MSIKRELTNPTFLQQQFISNINNAWLQVKYHFYFLAFEAFYATFDGSNSNFGSYAETALSVNKAPTDTSTTRQQTIPDYTMTIMAGVLAIIIAVAVAAVVIIVMVRKK